ncbi:hypothetical protein GCG21_13740 [Pseudactinotalea sp. HY160]|uniref:hypothetical protein n=1 Tax=Pseudactinotalea sp. HY160 TaxID=2654490 RepID=UPI00128E6393|nr:hypothetical protein [Pseudactinotalea sp. HY160]MPV51049.1 hypothetical protein [Pseudactinotalea sp. HY160]
MSSHDTPSNRQSPARQPAGQPTGGQFAEGQRPSPGIALNEPAAGPTLAEELDGISPGDGLWLERVDHGDPVLESVQASPSDDDPSTVHTSSTVTIWGGYEMLQQAVPRNIAANEEWSRQWLDERSDVVEAWLSDEYGMDDFEGDTEGIDHMVARFDVDVPASTPADGLTEAIHERTKAAALFNEQDHGTFGTRNMWDHLARHITAHEERVHNTSVAYAEAALWTEFDAMAVRSGKTDWDADDIAPGSARRMDRDISDFLTRNRATIDL